MTTMHDVIGAGAADEHCAGRLGAGGLDVTIVERELVAGECSYYACSAFHFALADLSSPITAGAR